MEKKGLVGVAYLPHGAMILDPGLNDLPNGAQQLNDSCMKISHRISQIEPDLVVLLTPHGIKIHHAFNVYQVRAGTSRANGDASWNGRWNDYQVNVELDNDQAKKLYSYLKENVPNVHGTVTFAGLSTPLRWGEVIPLYFTLVSFASKNATANNVPEKSIYVKGSPKVIIISQPERGCTEEEQNLYRTQRSDIQIEFGRKLRKWCDDSDRRILIVISGDQAHTHAWSSELSTIYQPDPSCFSIFPSQGKPEASQFDEHVIQWITGQKHDIHDETYCLDRQLVVDLAGPLEKEAISCGYAGSLTLQGLMENESIQNQVQDSVSNSPSSSIWALTNFYYARPTYYGMLSALFVRKTFS